MKERNQFFYTLWAAAIVVCVLLSVFALFFSACAKQGGDATEESGFTVESEAPDTGA